MLFGGVDDDLRRNELTWEVPEEFNQRRDVVDYIPLCWFVHLGNAVHLTSIHARNCSDLDRYIQATFKKFVA